MLWHQPTTTLLETAADPSSLHLQYQGEVAVAVVPVLVMETVTDTTTVMVVATVMVMAAPAIVLNLTTANMASNAGLIAPTPRGSNDLTYASPCPKANG